MNSSLDTLFKNIAKDYDIPKEVVKKIHDSVFSFIRNTVRDLPDLNELDTKDIAKLHSNFYITKFCRFFIDIQRIEKKRELNIKRYKKKC